MHFFRRDRKYIQEKMAVLKEQKTELAQEILLGEAVTGLVNTVEDNREYTCNDKPTDQTVLLQSKIKPQQVRGHGTNSLSPLAISMGPMPKH